MDEENDFSDSSESSSSDSEVDFIKVDSRINIDVEEEEKKKEKKRKKKKNKKRTKHRNGKKNRGGGPRPPGARRPPADPRVLRVAARGRARLGRLCRRRVLLVPRAGSLHGSTTLVYNQKAEETNDPKERKNERTE